MNRVVWSEAKPGNGDKDNKVTMQNDLMILKIYNKNRRSLKKVLKSMAIDEERPGKSINTLQ